MGVRIDRPGVRWWDYHTVGAGIHMRIAGGEGETKPGALLTRREYLCDASFLVALQGNPDLVEGLEEAVRAPRWTPYLGRKCCPPTRPLLEHPPGAFESLARAPAEVPWARRLREDTLPQRLDCLLDWMPSPEEPVAPGTALVWYDVPHTFEPPAHGPRVVMRKELCLGADGEVRVADRPLQQPVRAPSRPRVDYTNTQYQKARKVRLEMDHGLCVFCKAPATTVQHVTYRRAGGGESHADLRSLCRICHDSVTMLEYGLGMGLDRINPEDPRWRQPIIEKRRGILSFRSLETRRRRLSAEEVE